MLIIQDSCRCDLRNEAFYRLYFDMNRYICIQILNIRIKL